MADKMYGGVNINSQDRVNRLLIGTPMTGLVRAEWVFARYAQVIPCNWSYVDVAQMLNPSIPLGYQVSDAQNLIIKSVIEGGFEWLLFIEHDNILPPNTFVKMNEYMLDATVPIVSALYFTKSVPPEPLVYRQKGWSYYDKWKMGDKVWASGVPMGCTLINGKILREMWKDSPEYVFSSQVTRRVFNAPSRSWVDEKGATWSVGGTSDLAWCERVHKEGYFARAGFPKIQKREFPFLVDTSIFVKHITSDGVQYPIAVPRKFMPNAKS